MHIRYLISGVLFLSLNLAQAQSEYDEFIFNKGSYADRIIKLVENKEIDLVANDYWTFVKATEVFQEAKASHQVDSDTYAAYILAAGSTYSYDYEVAKKGIKRSFIDRAFAYFTHRWLHEDMPTVVDQEGAFIKPGTTNFVTAKSVFEEAKSSGLANSKVYNAFLVVGFSDYGVAKASFLEAVDKKLDTYSTYVHFVVTATTLAKYTDAKTAIEMAKAKGFNTDYMRDQLILRSPDADRLLEYENFLQGLKNDENSNSSNGGGSDPLNDIVDELLKNPNANHVFSGEEILPALEQEHAKDDEANRESAKVK